MCIIGDMYKEIYKRSGSVILLFISFHCCWFRFFIRHQTPLPRQIYWALISSIWVRTKLHLWWSDMVELPEVTWPDVTSVTSPEAALTESDVTGSDVTRHVTSGSSTTSLHHKCGFVRTHILLALQRSNDHAYPLSMPI